MHCKSWKWVYVSSDVDIAILFINGSLGWFRKDLWHFYYGTLKSNSDIPQYDYQLQPYKQNGVLSKMAFGCHYYSDYSGISEFAVPSNLIHSYTLTSWEDINTTIGKWSFQLLNHISGIFISLKLQTSLSLSGALMFSKAP